MAYDLLKKNNKNRMISRDKVNAMINDIKAGRFELTHQPIAIAEDGELVDGQHRLTAVYESGVPVDMFVAYNAPRSAKIDIGKPRDTRTALYMAGIIEKDSVEYNRGTYPLIKMIVCKQFGFITQRSLSSEELHAIYINHRKWIDQVVTIISRYSKTGVPIASSALTYVMLCALKSGCPIETIKEWYKIVATGNFVVDTDMEMTKIGQSVMNFINYASGKRIDIGTPIDRREEFIKKAMSSLSHYERKEIVSKIYGEYCYPMYELLPTDFYLEQTEAM